MDRRTLLKAGGAGIGAATIGGIGLFAFSGSGVAISSSFSISGASLSNDDGDITKVNVSAKHRAEWDGFDALVDAAAYRDVVQKMDGNGNVARQDVVYDNRAAPVRLANWSGNGDSNGWGGDGEWASGPGTQGFVRADIDWTVLAENPANAGGTESPGDIDNYGLDNPDDDSTASATLRYVKQVYLYTEDASGGVSADDGTLLRALGGDGTVEKIESKDTFSLGVTNEPAETGASGSGSASAQ